MNISNHIKINFSFVLFLLISLFSGLIFKSTLFLFCLLFHELGHILMIKAFDQKLNQIEITGFGMIISPDFKIHPLKKGLIYSGGLIFSLFLEILFIVLRQNLLIKINLLILLINIIPVPPLDGFNILLSSLELIFDEEYSLDFCLDLSIIMIVIITVLFLLTKQLFLLFIIIFSSTKIIKYKMTMKIRYLKRYLSFNNLMQISV